MRHGDWVKFVIATDRRDKLRRATKIELLDESFKVQIEIKLNKFTTELRSS